MRYRFVASSLVGVVFFGVLPAYAPPVVLQEDEIPYFLLGMALAAVAGAALTLASGRVRAIWLSPACALVGASLHTFAFAVPRYDLGEPWTVAVVYALFTFVYMGAPATAGAALAWAASAVVGRSRQRR